MTSSQKLQSPADGNGCFVQVWRSPLKAPSRPNPRVLRAATFWAVLWALRRPRNKDLSISRRRRFGARADHPRSRYSTCAAGRTLSGEGVIGTSGGGC